jgi:4-carboxymuconolactone decarboxylase
MTMPSAGLKLLYGEQEAQVFEFLEGLDPELNEYIQKLAYDTFWLRPGLGVREKSMVTLGALVAQRVQEPLKLHMTGFVMCGGTLDELRAVLLHLVPYVGFPAVLGAFSVMRALQREGKLPSEDSNS